MNHPMLILFGTLTWGCTNSKGASATSEPSSTEAADSATQDPGEPDDTGVHPAPGDSGHSNPQDTPPEDTSGGTAPHDTSGPDTSDPETEFGTISGDCGVLSLPGDSSRLIHNKIDFGSTPFDTEWLSAGGAEIFAEGTLGGSSIHSEVMAFEILHRCEGGALLKSETEISYIDPMGKKTDMLLSLCGGCRGCQCHPGIQMG